MNEHVTHLLQDYLDGDLTPQDARDVERHLAECTECRAVHAGLQRLVARMAELPASVQPPVDLWSGIRREIGNMSLSGTEASRDARPRRSALLQRRNGISPDRVAAPARRTPRFVPWAVAAAAVLGLLWILSTLGSPSWDVVTVDGTPTVADRTVSGTSKLRVGEWLETDSSSRARIRVGLIGDVDVEPNSRLQLRSAEADEHRIGLAVGGIDARIWAPPRLFFVDTPSATAIDLGCAYTMKVDDSGASRLHVTSGYVELAYDGRVSVVPAGMMCIARPDHGPGTPFDADAAPALKRALERFDFSAGGSDAVSEVLEAARPGDAVTLWQLLSRVESEDRPRVYDRLVELVDPPADVTRDGVLAGNAAMRAAWERVLGLDALTRWEYIKKKLRSLQPTAGE